MSESRMSIACGSRPEYGSSRKMHLGLVQQRAGDREALQHAARERAHEVEAPVVELDGRRAARGRAPSGSSTQYISAKNSRFSSAERSG